jgi:hypothetical protein
VAARVFIKKKKKKKTQLPPTCSNEKEEHWLKVVGFSPKYSFAGLPKTASTVHFVLWLNR